MADRPFTFRLERVRSLRERAEDQAREELARGLAHRLDGASALQAADAAADAAHDLTRGTLRAGAVGADLVAMHAFVEHTQRSRQTAALDLDRRDADVEARRVALVAAAREREVLDRLERRARARHEAENARLEQVVLDEIGLAVHRRGQVAA
jgi:flagellar protein FliJ